MHHGDAKTKTTQPGILNGTIGKTTMRTQTDHLSGYIEPPKEPEAKPIGKENSKAEAKAQASGAPQGTSTTGITIPMILEIQHLPKDKGKGNHHLSPRQLNLLHHLPPLQGGRAPTLLEPHDPYRECHLNPQALPVGDLD